MFSEHQKHPSSSFLPFPLSFSFPSSSSLHVSFSCQSEAAHTCQEQRLVQSSSVHQRCASQSHPHKNPCARGNEGDQVDPNEDVPIYELWFDMAGSILFADRSPGEVDDGNAFLVRPSS